MKGSLDWLKNRIGRIPIYGELRYSRKESRAAAQKELLITTLFSLFPLWFYPVVLMLAGSPVWTSLESFVVQGELFLYSAALLGPLVYAITKTYGVEEATGETTDDGGISRRTRTFQFPYGTWFVTISIVVCCFDAILFGLIRANVPGFTGLQLSEGTILVASGFLYGFTLSCMFCVLVYRIELEHVPEQFGNDTEELRSQWRNHHS